MMMGESKNDLNQCSKQIPIFHASDHNSKPFRTMHKLARFSDIFHAHKQTQDAWMETNEAMAQTKERREWAN